MKKDLLNKARILDNCRFVKSFRSRKNFVYLAKYKNNYVVVKQYKQTSPFISNERTLLKQMSHTGYTPNLLEEGKDYVIVSYIAGDILQDHFIKAMLKKDAKKLKKLAQALSIFLQMFHSVTGKILEDVNFTNFIMSKNKCYGIDFECAREGLPIEDVAEVVASAIFAANFDIEACWPFIATVLSSFHTNAIDVVNDLGKSLEKLSSKFDIPIEKEDLLSSFLSQYNSENNSTAQSSEGLPIRSGNI